MIKAPIPRSDFLRVAELESYKILDTPADEAFDDVTSLAAELCSTRMAMVSLVDADRQWFKAKVGLEMTQTPRDISFCGHAICQNDLFVVEDATLDERFCDNPLVTGEPHVRFYAGVPLRTPKGHALGVLCVVDQEPRAITPHVKRQLQLLGRQTCRLLELHRLCANAAKDASEDPLTGLANRRGLLKQLEMLLQHTRAQSDCRLALAYVDLDRFKPINDNYGHDVGNIVLCEMSRRLEQTVATLGESQSLDAWCVARLGGDEFVAAVCGQFDESWLNQTLGPRVVDAMSQPVSWEDKQLTCGVSLGLALDDGIVPSGEELLRYADIAMYHAKRDGGYRSTTFSSAMKSAAVEQVELEAALRQAIASREIGTAYQPILDLQEGRVVGFETLARWMHPKFGAVPAPVFISIAERTGLMGPLFDLILSQALNVLRLLQADQPAWISLNISKVQIEDASFCSRLTEAVCAAHIAPSAVKLDVTESALSESESLIRHLLHLCDRGFEVMLDDFGMSTASLSTLHAYPVQWLKIDPHLLHNAMQERETAAVLNAVATLAQNLNLKVIAEGVEAVEQIPLLQAMDIRYGQGYAIGRPVDRAQVGFVRQKIAQGLLCSI